MKKIKKFFFENTNIKQTIVKNSFWMTLGIFFIKFVRAIIIIYAARLLGTENYGIYTYLFSLVAIFSFFSDIGLINILTRDIAKHSEEKSQYISTTLFLKLGLLSLIVILISLIVPLISKFDGMTIIIIIMAITMGIESLKNFFYAIPRAENKMQVETGLLISTEIISIFIIIFIFFKNPSIKSLAIAYMIGNFTGLFITILFLHKKLIGIFKNFNKKLIKYILTSAWPFAIMGFFGIFMANIDSIIIGIYGNANMLGAYAAAQRPISLLYIIPGILTTILFPIISKLMKEGKGKQISLIINKSSVLLLGIGLPIVIGGIILAKPLINVVYGYQYIGATLTFQFLLLTILLMFPNTIWSDVLFAENKQKIFLKSSILGALTNVGLDFLLIPIYGIVGSAVATILSLLVVNIIFFIEVNKNYKLNITKQMKKIIFSAIIMGFVVFIMKTLFWPLILIITLAIIIYFGILFILKEEIIEDIKQGFIIS